MHCMALWIGGGGGGSYYIIDSWALLAELSRDTLFWGFVFGNVGRPPKIIYKGDGKTTNPVVVKS